ncbi:MAG: pyridoxamine 5'-phosphate oxidase family protein [Gammaproteobacteria bacterium]|nr:pyridoxamine 5'-phosphate oxidase family protein [Gammaproteobacteria bacterium]
MISDNPEFEDFIDKNTWAILTALRSNGSPVSAAVMYARDGDTLVVSTPGKTFKRKMLANDSRANLCIIDNNDPPNFVAIESEVSVETENVLEGTRPVFDKMKVLGHPVPEIPDEWLKRQKRVVLRFIPKKISGVTRF